MTTEPVSFPEDTEELLAEASQDELRSLQRTARTRSEDAELPEDIRDEWHTLAGQVAEELDRRLRGEA